MRTRSSGLRALALAWLALLAATFACGQSAEPIEGEVPVIAPKGGAVVVRVEGELSLATLAVVTRAIRTAKEEQRNVLIIDLDTPGGRIDTMRTLANLIKDSESPELRTVTWVHDRATSAGVLVTLSTRRVFMASRSTIGAATPVVLGPEGLAPVPDEEVRAKLMSDMRAQFRSWAEDHGRPGLLAEAMIDSQVAVLEVRVDGELRFVSRSEWSDIREQGESGQLVSTLSPAGELLSLTALEAVATGFADGIAETLADVLEKAGAGEREPLLITAMTSEQLLGWLEMATPILIALGLMLAFTELKVPGFGLPGILSLVCFAVAFGGRYFVGLADVPQLVLVTLGFALVAIELFALPGTIWFGLSGGVLILGGLFWSQLGAGFAFTNPLDRRFLYDGAFQLLVTGAVALIGSILLVRFLPNLPGANRLLMTPEGGSAFGDGLPELDAARTRARIGARGEVLTDLRPVGKVTLGGDRSLEFEARSPGAVLERGTAFVVVAVEGDRLVVEPAEQEEV